MAFCELLHNARDALVRIVTYSMPMFPAGVSSEIRIRPFAIAITSLSMAVALYLGFHPTAGQSLPRQSDKILHFLAFAVMTFCSAWIVSIQSETNSLIRLWQRRYALCNLVAWMAASILSEFVQALVPSKTFQYGDVLGNIAGSIAGSAGASIVQARNTEALGGYLLLASEDPVPQRRSP